MTASAHSDFGDRLSPFLVKELRQGLRSRLFVAALLWMQVLMVVFTSLSAGLHSDEFGFNWDFYYWTGLLGLLHLIIPFRDLLSGDVDRRTESWDLIIITGISSERLMLSKWAGSCALIAICWVSMLPYQLVRYFAGGVEVVNEVVLLLVVLANAFVFSLWGLFLATLNKGWRTMMCFIALPALIIADAMSLVPIAMASQLSTSDASWVCVGLVYVVVALFSFGFASSRFDYDMLRIASYIPPEQRPSDYPSCEPETMGNSNGGSASDSRSTPSAS